VAAFAPWVLPADWSRWPSRVARSVDRLLALLADHQARATFFVLGWLAQRHPEVVRDIAAAGHEIASHGWDHARVTGQTPVAFRTSVRRTKQLLEALTGSPVLGFRAPSFSIIPGQEWALDVLIEEGYRYDSSLFPVRRRGYGYPNGRREPHWIDRAGGRLLEVGSPSLPVAAPISACSRTPCSAQRSATTSVAVSRPRSTSTRGRSTRSSRASPCRC